MNILNYIDFEKCWNDIKAKWKDYLVDIDNQNIADFIKCGRDKEMFLLTEECSLGDDSVTFCFSEEYNTANESDNTNEWFSILITYDLMNEEFTFYETDQG